MRNIIKPILGLMAVVVALMVSGCETARTATLPQTGNAAILMSRPDANQARQYAPEWARAALHAIIDLEARVKELEAQRQ